MKKISKSQSLVWGGLLIVFGLIGLLDSYLELSVWAWAGAFAISGFGVLGVYFSNRSERWTLIPAYVLLVVASLLFLLEMNLLQDGYVAAYVLLAIAVPFLYIYFKNRSQWWPLIPAYVMLLIAIMIPLDELNILQDAFIATYILGGIAFPFLFVYARDRSNWWALIPAYVLLSVGIMVGLIDTRVLSDMLIPAYVMFSIAIPFLFVYVRNPSEWWPLIPGGVMGLIGMVFLLSERSTRIIAPVLVIVVGVFILLRQFFRPSVSDE
jgi:hypothetical protein